MKTLATTMLLTTALLTTSLHVNAEIDILNIGDTKYADASMIIGVGSRHFDSDKHNALNESNPSIGFEAWDVQAVYITKNSWEKDSVYLTYSPDYELNKYITITPNIGLATGYKCSNRAVHGYVEYAPEFCSNSGVIPLAALTISYSPLANEYSLSASITKEVAMFSVSYSFK